MTATIPDTLPLHSRLCRLLLPARLIVLAIRSCLHLALSYRDDEELLADRGIEVYHATIYR